MGKYWSSEVDKVLSDGHSLEHVGVRNWALNKEAALAALTKLAEAGVGVLGGDVYSVNDTLVESNYDSWYCERNEHEVESAFVVRSIAMARNYIADYPAPEGAVLFAIVPKI